MLEGDLSNPLANCAICGQPAGAGGPTALITVRAPSGKTAALGAHGPCVIGVLHPAARAILDAAPVIPEEA
jgi:hypothetical protein